jgi:YVTN family beta-propeller protein
MAGLAEMQFAFEVGSLIGGYRIVEVVGRGGMGVVYRAEQPSLDREVAVKVMAEALSRDERFRRRFVRESRLAASIDHPHVLPIFEAGEQAGALFMAMQFIPEGDLGRLLHAGRLEPARAVALVRQVAAALDAAHARGLVHRDVKPANVLIARGAGDWHAYLTDFGISARHGSHSGLTGSGGWVGSVDYVAPEQIGDAPVDGRADVYSLGCLFYEALTGEVPFPRTNEVAKLWAQMRDEPPPVSARPGVPRELDQVLARAIAKDPGSRYQSAGELAAEASAALNAAAERHVAAPLARRATRLARAPGRISRRRLVVAAGCVAVLGGAVALAVALSGEAHAAHGVARPRPVGIVDGAPIPVGNEPMALAGGGGRVWVANTGDNTVSVIDPHTNSVTGPAIKVGEEPQAITLAGGFAWVANHADRTVTRIDERSRRVVGKPVRVLGGPYQLAPAGRYVWVASEAPGALSAIDTRTGRLASAPLRLGSGLGGGLAADRNTVWVGFFVRRAVQRVDARTSRPFGRPLTAGGHPEDVLLTPGLVWLALGADHSMARLDRRSGSLVGAPIRVGEYPIALAKGRGSVWSVDRTDALYRLDPRSGRSLGRPVRVGSGPLDVAVADGSVWVANEEGNSVTRVLPTPLRGSR